MTSSPQPSDNQIPHTSPANPPIVTEHTTASGVSYTKYVSNSGAGATSAGGSSGDQAKAQDPAPAIVLIHGVVHSRTAWEDVIPLLTGYDQHGPNQEGMPSYTIYALDLPGHGQSVQVDTKAIKAEGKDLRDTLLNMTAEVLDQATKDTGQKPLVVGNSLGGYTAIELCRRGHGREAVAFSPAGFFLGKWDQTRTIVQFLTLRAIARVLEPVMPIMAKSRIGRTAAMGMFSARPWAIPAHRVVRDAGGLLTNTLINDALSVEFPFSSDVNPANPAPIHCLWGTLDLTLIRGWTVHDKILPEASLTKLPGLGHVTMFDDPALVAREVMAIARQNNNV